MKYDVFISYRREGGSDLARLIYEKLRLMGFSVFFDLEELRAGTFDEKLYTAIEESANVAVVLPEGALERCREEGDWLRLEIEHALKSGKNLVPVMMPDFHWPGKLPASMQAFPRFNGVKWSHVYFDASVRKLESLLVGVSRTPSAPSGNAAADAEDVFLSRARRFKRNDGVIDSTERAELDALADRLKIGVVRREYLIEQVENGDLSPISGHIAPPDSSVPVPAAAGPLPARFVVLAGRQISYGDIVEATELDAISYPECYRGDPDTCRAWAAANPDIYVMLRDTKTGKIVAYINVMPVTDECYDRMKDGSFIDVDISPNSILPYDMPCPYSVYFSSVVIHPEYRNTGVFKFLFDAILNRFLELGEGEVFIRRMLADAVSPEGEKFCKLFGMSRIGSTAHGSTLYEVSMIPPKFRVTSQMTKRLFDYYAAKYREEPYLFESP